MAVALTKPWLPISTCDQVLKGQTGVFELADDQQRVIFVGFAGGKSLHGLRGEVLDNAKVMAASAFFRAEVTTAYHTRYRELLMWHQAAGQLPPHSLVHSLGKLSPG